MGSSHPLSITRRSISVKRCGSQLEEKSPCHQSVSGRSLSTWAKMVLARRFCLHPRIERHLLGADAFVAAVPQLAVGCDPCAHHRRAVARFQGYRAGRGRRAHGSLRGSLRCSPEEYPGFRNRWQNSSSKPGSWPHCFPTAASGCGRLRQAQPLRPVPVMAVL